jgi:anaerobic C4-dicarboxylate transporter
MPEIIEEEKIVEKTDVKPVTVLSTISGVVLSALVTLGVTDKIEQDAYQAKISRAKTEVCAEYTIPEKTVETLYDTVIAGDTVTLTDCK